MWLVLQVIGKNHLKLVSDFVNGAVFYMFAWFCLRFDSWREKNETRVCRPDAARIFCLPILNKSVSEGSLELKHTLNQKLYEVEIKIEDPSAYPLHLVTLANHLPRFATCWSCWVVRLPAQETLGLDVWDPWAFFKLLDADGGSGDGFLNWPSGCGVSNIFNLSKLRTGNITLFD